MSKATEYATVVLGRANKDLESRFALTDHFEAAVIEQTVLDASRQNRETLITFKQADHEFTVSVGQGSWVQTRRRFSESGDEASIHEQAARALGDGRLVIRSLVTTRGINVQPDGTVADWRDIIDGYNEERAVPDWATE